VNADGSYQQRMTSEFGQFFAWSPDGAVILVTGLSGLYLIRPDGTGMTPFEVPGVAYPLFPDWISKPHTGSRQGTKSSRRGLAA